MYLLAAGFHIFLFHISKQWRLTLYRFFSTLGVLVYNDFLVTKITCHRPSHHIAWHRHWKKMWHDQQTPPPASHSFLETITKKQKKKKTCQPIVGESLSSSASWNSNNGEWWWRRCLVVVTMMTKSIPHKITGRLSGVAGCCGFSVAAAVVFVRKLEKTSVFLFCFSCLFCNQFYKNPKRTKKKSCSSPPKRWFTCTCAAVWLFPTSSFNVGSPPATTTNHILFVQFIVFLKYLCFLSKIPVLSSPSVSDEESKIVSKRY